MEFINVQVPGKCTAMFGNTTEGAARAIAYLAAQIAPELATEEPPPRIPPGNDHIEAPRS